MGWGTEVSLEIKRNSSCGLQNKSSSYCNVSNMLIVLHSLIYIVFENTVSMIKVSDREEALRFRTTSSKNMCGLLQQILHSCKS